LREGGGGRTGLGLRGSARAALGGRRGGERSGREIHCFIRRHAYQINIHVLACRGLDANKTIN
jgi:hypothetical protein